MTTVKELAEVYRTKLHSEGRLTMDTEKRVAEFEKAWGGRKAESLTPVEIQTYFSRKYAGRSPGTINRNMGALIAMLAYGEELGIVKARPRIKRRRHRDEREVHLELDEIMPVVERVRLEKGPLHGFAILLLIDTGLRLGEALHLRWGDLRQDWITVRLNTYGNSKTKQRMIPTSPRLLEYMTKYKILPLTSDTKENKILGDRWNEETAVISRRLNSVLREACISVGTQCAGEIRVHDLRHTFAYLCAHSGADLADIKELLGHSTLNVTMRYRGFVQTRAAEIIRKGMAVKYGS